VREWICRDRFRNAVRVLHQGLRQDAEVVQLAEEFTAEAAYGGDSSP
jgi:hypothetical protein